MFFTLYITTIYCDKRTGEKQGNEAPGTFLLTDRTTTEARDDASRAPGKLCVRKGKHEHGKGGGETRDPDRLEFLHHI